jgi:hypothetical protein
MLILDGKALKALIRAAVALNTSSAAHELILVSGSHPPTFAATS